MPLLETRNLTKKFGGLVAVSNVSFHVDEGEILGLIGPNGAGKTTVFNLLTGFYAPDGGSVFFQDRDITGLKPHEICSLGLVRTFQLVKPFLDMSVLDNVVVGALLRTDSLEVARSEAERAIESVGLGKIRSLPAKNLTTPQRKRVELARALATRPRMLLIDEVAAGLNAAEVEGVVSLIKGIHDLGVTVCCVEHVMTFIMNISDRIVVLDQGAKIAEGRPEQVAADQAVISAYLGIGYA